MLWILAGFKINGTTIGFTIGEEMTEISVNQAITNIMRTDYNLYRKKENCFHAQHTQAS